MNYQIREMTAADYDAAMELWKNTEYLGLNECDTPEGIALYLNRNPGLSFVAEAEGVVVGTVLGGHDGRRGMLRHLAVSLEHRRSGLGRNLIEHALAAMADQGIEKCNIMVQSANARGLEFWEHMGWGRMNDAYYTMQKNTRLLRLTM